MATLGYLASFHAVCQTLNISSAAKNLGLTQPSLSRQLKCLEESLRVTLFVRRQRGIALTDEGLKLAEAVAPVIMALNERLDILRHQGVSTKGRLRVASLTEIGKSYVLPRLLTFTRDYPEVEVDFRLLKGDEIVAALLAQEIDFGIVAEMPEHDKLKVSKLTEERSILVTHSTNSRSLHTVGDVNASRFVAYRPDDPLLKAFLKAHFPGVNVSRIHPHFTVNDHKCMIEALIALNAYAVIPRHSVAGYLEAGTLRNASEHELRLKVWLIRPEKQRETLISKAFTAALTG